MSRNWSTATANNSSSVVMKRKAINASGRLGSLYDGRRDHVVTRRNISVRGQGFKSSKLPQCELISGNIDVSRNILRILGIEDDLRLSLLLNLTHRTGVAAILNHPYRINENTRLLYYTWIDREEHVSDEIINNLKLNESRNLTTFGTHVITDISFGIDVLFVIQLPSEGDIVHRIDLILKKMRNILLKDEKNSLQLTSEEIDLLKHTTNMTVYSNATDLTGLNTVRQLLHQINIIKRKSNYCPPITYFLRSLDLLLSRHFEKNITFYVLPPEFNNNLEKYLLHKRAIVTNLKLVFQENVMKLLSGHLAGRLHGAHVQWLNTNERYTLEMKQLSELVKHFRSGQVELSVLRDTLNDKERATLEKNEDELIQNLHDLETKAYLISDLLRENFKYCNVIDRDVSNRDNETTIRNKLNINGQRERILCSNDTLNKNNRKQLERFLSDLMKERQNNHILRLMYADFSYSSFPLRNMVILPSDQISHHRTHFTPQTSVSINTSRGSSTFSSSTTEDINILLLGETGVGKSTFINALANYLTFNSLEQAQRNEPMVLIPVSFLMTIGDNFEERIVKFGGTTRSNNEDFNHPGQSVTQHCKPYIFRLSQLKGKKIRIIDTPGFGDTRGLDQDDRNMQHILQSINNLTHLNAICFLLKPNASQLNIFFRTCFAQLSSFLGPNARQNIIFCFTNARSTFYTPGNTAPLLKAMLASLPMGDIAFKKENTFCFDNESFRYLVAIRNTISFNQEDKREYEMSWATSVKESIRLIDYIHNRLTPHVIPRRR